MIDTPRTFPTLLACTVLAASGLAFAQNSDVVKASTFGFNKENATKCLQAALNSGASKVIIDNVGAPWLVEPITLVSNQTVIVQDGVVVMAIADKFKGTHDSLFNLIQVKNVTIEGEGKAILKMRKKDYQDPTRYEFSEWRHALNLCGAENVIIRNLTIESSGGDGVYLRDAGIPACRNISLENLVCNDHHRQGISVISAENLLVRNCKFNTTSGTAPQCGIDIEPNKAQNRLINNTFENCEFNANAAKGIDLHLAGLDATTPPVSILFRDCVTNANNSHGFYITASHGTSAVNGFVNFENCTAAQNRAGTVCIIGQQPDTLAITFRDCIFDNTDAPSPALAFHSGSAKGDFDGVTFINCKLVPGEAKAMTFIPSSGYGIKGLYGDVTLPDNSKLDFQKLISANQPDLELRNFSTDVLNLKEVIPFKNDRKLTKPNPVTTRHNFAIAVFLPKAGDYTVTFIPRKIGTAIPRTQATMLDAMGNAMDQFAFRDEPYTYTIHANGQNIVQFRLTGVHGMSIEATAPWGYIANERVALFRGGHHDFYFVAPAGLREVRMEVNTEMNEPVDAALVNQDGKVVNEIKAISGTGILLAKREANEPDQIWILRMTRVKEDHSFRFGAGILPIAATDPQNLLIKK